MEGLTIDKRDNLTIADIVQNFELFKGKKYIEQLVEEERSVIEKSGISENDIDKFIELSNEMARNFAEISINGFVSMIEATKDGKKQEEIQKKINDVLSNMTMDMNPKKINDWLNIAKKLSGFGLDFEQILDFMSSPIADDGGMTFINYGIGEKVKEIIDSVGEEKFRTYDIPFYIICDEKFLEILEYYGIETIMRVVETYNIPFDIMCNKNVLTIFKTYGIETIMKFDSENGNIFSANNYEVLKGMQKAYLRWQSWENEADLLFKQSENGEKIQYSAEEFEEVIRRMIIYYTPKEGGLPYEKIQGTFREKNQDLYISEDAPEELQKAFYEKKLTLSLIQKYPEYIEQLLNITEIESRIFGEYGKSLTFMGKFTTEEIFELARMYGEQIDRIGVSQIKNRGFSYEIIIMLFGEGFNEKFLKGILTKEINSKFIKKNEEDVRRVATLAIDIVKLCNLQLQTAFEYVKSTYIKKDEDDLEILFELSRNYPRYIEDAWKFSQELDDVPAYIDEAMQRVEDFIESTILQGKIVYNEDAPEFMKKKHPELFLSEDAPYELKCKYYNLFGNNYPLKFADLLNYKEFLQGKNLALIGDVNFANLFKVFSVEEVLDFITIEKEIEVEGKKEKIEVVDEKVAEGLKLLMAGGLEQIQNLKKFLEEKTEYFARKELLEINKIDSVTLDSIISGEKEDERTLNLYNSKKDKFKKAILRNPGVILYYPEQEIDKFSFGEYEELKHLSRFEDTTNYRFDISEQIISTMYAYLGFRECKEILKLPELSEEQIKALRQANEEVFNQVYEIRYDIGGSLKPTNEFFNKLLPMIQGKKNVLKVYKSLNQKIMEGTTSDLEQLIIECFEENGIQLNEEKIKHCAVSTIRKHTSVKMEQLENLLRYQMTERIPETDENRKILKDILTNALRNSFNENERIDIEQIRNEIANEFERKREDGTTFYSEHVTSHLEDLMQIVEHLNNRKFEVKLNQSFVELLGEEKEKIGERWIAKLASVPDDVTKEELEEIEKQLYGEELGYYIRADRRIELRDKSEEGEAKAYEYLRSHQDTWAFTEIQGEQMFAGLSYPFSEEFKKFYIANKKEILHNPEYYTKFQRMHSEFDRIIEKPEIKNRFEAGKFTIEQLITELEHITYSGVKEGEEELEYKARKSGLEREYFKTAQKIFEEMKKREYQTIPQEETVHKRFRGRILRLDDPLQLFMGNITTCCQQLGEGQPGETSMIHSATEENGAVFVVEEMDEFGNVTNVVAQSWVWRNGNIACFDNVEIPGTLGKRLREIDAYDEILKIYQETAARMIETDAKTMKKLLELGKITQEQYDSLVLRDITVGTGCDDLIRKVSDEEKKKLEAARGIKLPKEINKKYQGVGQRDKGLYSDARGKQYILAKNDEVYDREVDTKLDVSDIPLKYTRIREVVRRDGFEIHSEMFKRIKQICQNSGEVEHIISDEMEGIYDFIEKISDNPGEYNKDNLSVSISENDDWYMLLEETEDAITILDSAIVTKQESEKEIDIIDKKMALMEYTREMYMYLKKASMTGKRLQLNLGREGKFSNIQALIDEGIISVEDSSITVNNLEELEQRLEAIEKTIETERRNRLTLGIEEQERDE